MALLPPPPNCCDYRRAPPSVGCSEWTQGFLQTINILHPLIPFIDRVPHCNPGRPRTHCVIWTDLRQVTALCLSFPSSGITGMSLHHAFPNCLSLLLPSSPSGHPGLCFARTPLLSRDPPLPLVEAQGTLQGRRWMEEGIGWF